MISTVLKEPDGLRNYGIAFLYVVGAYVLGFAGLFNASWLVKGLATLLLVHAMTIAAYLIHECGHNLVFKRQRDNTRLGRVLSWFCGAAYGTYEDMRYKHFLVRVRGVVREAPGHTASYALARVVLHPGS